MAGKGKVVEPSKDLTVQEYHHNKYRVFLEMYNHQMMYRTIMKGRTCDPKCSGNVTAKR